MEALPLVLDIFWPQYNEKSPGRISPVGAKMKNSQFDRQEYNEDERLVLCMSKCIFCDKKLENKTSGDQECSVFLECPECGNYGLHPEFERIAINDPESFQKWLSQNQLAILEIIRDCNLDGHPCLLEKNIYDRHNFYPSENRIIPT